ncbi:MULTISPECIES: hypothetical protein [unclassified Pseudomonas]|nr:hypothetical protein [Pseudomonas sp. MWU12-2020]
MSGTEYTRILETPLSEIHKMGIWAFARYFQASGPVQRQMILRALGR